MMPVILAVHFPAKKLAKLRMAAMRLGAKVRVVEKWEYLNAVGALTGDLDSFESFYDGEDFPGELLVFAHFSDAEPVFAGHTRSKAPARCTESRPDGRK